MAMTGGNGNNGLVTGSLISFIIPNWNRKDLLHACIKSIHETMQAGRFEIIVVDNGSTDGSDRLIAGSFSGVRWIGNDTNRGYAPAVNQGAALSRGDVLYLLNNDVRLLEGTAAGLNSCLDEHDDAGAVAPLLSYPDGRLQVSCRRFPTPQALVLEAFGIDRIGSFRRWKLVEHEHLRGGVVEQPMASVLAIRRRCWEEVGPMDEGFPIFFNDVDWCFRLYRDTRWKIYLCTGARAIHHHGATTASLGFRKRIEFLRGLARFYRKHYLFGA